MIIIIIISQVTFVHQYVKTRGWGIKISVSFFRFLILCHLTSLLGMDSFACFLFLVLLFRKIFPGLKQKHSLILLHFLFLLPSNFRLSLLPQFSHQPTVFYSLGLGFFFFYCTEVASSKVNPSPLSFSLLNLHNNSTQILWSNFSLWILSPCFHDDIEIPVFITFLLIWIICLFIFLLFGHFTKHRVKIFSLRTLTLFMGLRVYSPPRIPHKPLVLTSDWVSVLN